MEDVKPLIKKFGDPFDSDEKISFERQWMVLWEYPKEIKQAFPALGQGIYINRVFQPTYSAFLKLLISRGLHTEVKENDQCFMVRYQRGTEKLTNPVPSIHSWGLAVDLNPSQNPLGMSKEQAEKKGLKPFSNEFQQAGRDAGLTCGIDFIRKDGMHFQMKF